MPQIENVPQMRLFQNFSFWNSFLGFTGKTGFSIGFSKSLQIKPVPKPCAFSAQSISFGTGSNYNIERHLSGTTLDGCPGNTLYRHGKVSTNKGT
ncbi:MAG: hypothetical protein LBB98_05050 [Treponema sp.]|jgi:hypothetical protein|nr:hypothetical protein [Treponema sp.]